MNNILGDHLKLKSFTNDFLNKFAKYIQQYDKSEHFSGNCIKTLLDLGIIMNDDDLKYNG